MNMKQIILVALAALLVLPQEAPAQAFPSRPVRILCPFPPGCKVKPGKTIG